MIIVTGGAGFIGSQLIRALNRQSITDILIVDHMGTSTKYMNLTGLNFSDYIEKDVFIDNLDHIARGASYIFHFGACSNTTETNGSYMIANNYAYSKRLIQYALNHTIDMIYASSAAVYGLGDNGFSENTSPETPLNSYAVSKWLTDNYTRRTLQERPANQILGLRFFNVFGPGESHKAGMASVAYHLFEQVRTTDSIALFLGSENFKRDFIYITDVIAVILYFYKHRESGIINCGTGRAQSFYDMALTLLEVVNKADATIHYTPFPQHLDGKYQAYTQADTTLLNLYGFNQTFLNLYTALSDYRAYLWT